MIEKGLLSHYMMALGEAGIDEAGRGCLAGPVFAAAVMLPCGFDIDGLDDSKKLSEGQRAALRIKIESGALCWAVGMATAAEIDRINILQATFVAMHRAIDGLTVRPEALLIDGNRFRRYQYLPYQCIVGGDGKYQSIAAASILAKTHRDAYMQEADSQHPEYGWAQNKGYGTPSHVAALKLHGPCKEHRASFKLKSALSLET
jgi:ribonuclease HII